MCGVDKVAEHGWTMVGGQRSCKVSIEASFPGMLSCHTWAHALKNMVSSTGLFPGVILAFVPRCCIL